MGKEVLEITEPGWRVSKDSVEKVVEKIGKEVDSTWIVVLQLLDNSVYLLKMTMVRGISPVRERTGNITLRGR
jgi:hypothetical protein